MLKLCKSTKWNNAFNIFPVCNIKIGLVVVNWHFVVRCHVSLSEKNPCSLGHLESHHVWTEAIALQRDGSHPEQIRVVDEGSMQRKPSGFEARITIHLLLRFHYMFKDCPTFSDKFAGYSSSTSLKANICFGVQLLMEYYQCLHITGIRKRGLLK